VYGESLSLDALRDFSYISRLSLYQPSGAQGGWRRHIFTGLVDWKEKLVAKVDVHTNTQPGFAVAYATTRADTLGSSQVVHEELGDLRIRYKLDMYT
jgi:hypothetical protein